MRTRIWWSLLIVSFAVVSYRGQEKQPPKQEEPPAAAAPTSAPQSPHTYNLSREDKERKNPVRFNDLSVERGKKLFQSQCAMCHGKNADGKGEAVEDLHIQPSDLTKPALLKGRSDGELFAIIGQGSETMPGEDKRMTERQRWQIVNYLRSIEGKAPAKASETERAEEDTITVSDH